MIHPLVAFSGFFWLLQGSRKPFRSEICFGYLQNSKRETKKGFEWWRDSCGSKYGRNFALNVLARALKRRNVLLKVQKSAFVVFWKLKKWLAKRFNAKICFGLLQKGWKNLPRLLATFWKGIVLRLSPKEWREDEILSMFGQTTAKGTILRWDLTFKTLREQQETLNCHFQTRDLLKTAWKYQLSFPKSRKTHKNHSPFLQEAKEQQNLVTLSN